jgi:hypothetical protein
MGKKLTDFTTREKAIGILVAGFAVITIGGIASAIGGTPSAITPPTSTPTSAVTYDTAQETEVIPFSKESQDDSSMNSGTSKVTTAGVNGLKTKTYKTTISGGVETKRELISEMTTTQPTTEVTSIGTYVAPVKKAASNCDPNYSGKCVPIASDVDCAGGSGNGPAYVSGPVYVIGSDIYGLDRDGDGVGCE